MAITLSTGAEYNPRLADRLSGVFTKDGTGSGSAIKERLRETSMMGLGTVAESFLGSGVGDFFRSRAIASDEPKMKMSDRMRIMKAEIESLFGKHRRDQIDILRSEFISPNIENERELKSRIESVKTRLEEEANEKIKKENIRSDEEVVKVEAEFNRKLEILTKELEDKYQKDLKTKLPKVSLGGVERAPKISASSTKESSSNIEANETFMRVAESDSKNIERIADATEGLLDEWKGPAQKVEKVKPEVKKPLDDSIRRKEEDEKYESKLKPIEKRTLVDKALKVEKDRPKIEKKEKDSESLLKKLGMKFGGAGGIGDLAKSASVMMGSVLSKAMAALPMLALPALAVASLASDINETMKNPEVIHQREGGLDAEQINQDILGYDPEEGFDRKERRRREAEAKAEMVKKEQDSLQKQQANELQKLTDESKPGANQNITNITNNNVVSNSSKGSGGKENLNYSTENPEKTLRRLKEKAFALAFI